jgi:hypothetical protein
MSLEWEMLYMMYLYLHDPWMQKKLIDGIKSWDITCEIWLFCASTTLENKMIYYHFVLDDPWMRNTIYDGFVHRWPLIVKYDVESIWL